MDRTVQDALEHQLMEYSLRVDGPVPLRDLTPEIPAPLQLVHQREAQLFNTVSTDTPTLTRLLRFEDLTGEPLLVLAPFVHPRSAQQLRNAGIRFLDAAGNAYLRFEGVLIDVRGRRPDPSITLRTRKARTSTNLFAPRRAQVVFALLSWPALLGASVRSIATAAKVSVGQAQSTLELLDEHDFLDRHTGSLLRREVLAEHWADAFATGLGPKTLLHQFRGDPSRMELDGHGAIYVSGEQAAPWIRDPETATLYVEEFSPEMALTNRWRADGTANIMVRSVFWAYPDQDVDPRFPTVAPPLLVYADLKSTRESRQLEAAQQIKESHAHIWHP
ncbi:type IV toxin-antitoxin system AbiEi family antitoxin [Kocuria marina]|uniref:type IV toxin-antitoxin system AbiEi family antitoxin n=1 Tax=Kocuria marina TaxID=223184 RepID=UPI0016432491|nr:type IV toxin-antitoxin system AbiEi family antitoxin [Kocuria indica]